MKVAQIRYDREARLWSLHWRDRNGRWHPYDDVDPMSDVEAILAEVDRDPTGIFWG